MSDRKPRLEWVDTGVGSTVASIGKHHLCAWEGGFSVDGNRGYICETYLSAQLAAEDALDALIRPVALAMGYTKEGE